MLKSLENLQYGFESPRYFRTSVANHRIVNLALSSHTKLEKFHTGGVNTLDIDGVEERYLISGAKDGGLCIHDLQNSTGRAAYTPKLICQVPRRSRYSHEYSITAVQWYPHDTGLFISSGMDAKLKIWDANAMKPAEVFGMQAKINAHHMSPISSRSLIAVAMDHPHIVLLDPRSGSRCHELRAHRTCVSCVRWSPSSEFLLVTGGFDSKVYLWDVRSAKGYLSTLDQHNGEAQGNAKGLVTAHDGAVNGLRFTDDGLHLVSCGTDERLRLWDVALCTNTLVNYGLVINNNQYRQRRIDICCNTSPHVIFVPSSKHVASFDLFSGSRIATLVGHFRSVNCCLYRPSAHQLFSGGNDTNILLWTPDTHQEMAEKKEGTEEGEASPTNSDNWSSDYET